MEGARGARTLSARDHGFVQFSLVGTIFAASLIFMIGVGNALTGFVGGNYWTAAFLAIALSNLWTIWFLWQVLKHNSWSAVTRRGRRGAGS
jgi:hypothetical protein